MTTLNKLTKAQLIEQVEALGVLHDGACARIAELETELAAYQVAERPSRQAPRTPETPKSDYRARCEAARALAQKTGRPVLLSR